MKMTGSRAYTRPTPVPKMPPGLVELIEGMTKEVLRCNPTNVYEFCATHLHKLLEIRDGPTGKRVFTLEQRILKAQAVIKLRAQDRQQKYDRDMQLISKTENKELASQITFIKKPDTHGNSSSKVEEMEISQQYEINPTISEVNNKISKATDKLSIIKETTISIDKNNHQINELETNTKDENLEVLSTAPISLECIKTSESNVTNNVLKKSDHSEVYEEKNDIILVQEPEEEPSPIKILKVNEKVQNDLVIPMINQNTESYSIDCSVDKNKDVAKIQSIDKEIKIEIENNVPDDTDVGFFDDNIRKESVFEDKIIDCTVKDDDPYNLTKKDNKSNSMPNNSEHDNGPSFIDDHSCNNSYNTENDRVRIHDDSNNVSDVSNSTFDKTPTLNDNKSILLPLNEESVKGAKQEDSKNERSEIGEKYEQSRPNSNTLPTKENPTELVPSNDRETNNMDLETAAITIQKVFRSFLFKSRASNDETSSIDDDNKEANGYSSPNSSKERRPLGINRMDTMLQTVNEEKSLSLSTDDSSTLSSAATIIQAHIRGFLVRNKLNSNKTSSTNSILNSEDPVTQSPDSEMNQNNNKTILNIHIVPESNIPSLSHDESIAASMDLSLDGSPPSSINLHPLGYDKSEPRKQLKREDAFQSVSPPSNNSGKLSDDIDSTKEVLISGAISNDNVICESEHIDKITIVPDVPVVRKDPDESSEDSAAVSAKDIKPKRNSITKMSSDEMDVVTPFTSDESQRLPESSNSTKLMHSGELHDVVLPTNVSRSSTSVVRGE